MQKHRRCSENWWDGHYLVCCDLPDDGHSIHTYAELNKEGKYIKIQWCDKKYKDLL